MNIQSTDDVADEVASAIEAGVRRFNVETGPMASAARVFTTARNEAGELTAGA